MATAKRIMQYMPSVALESIDFQPTNFFKELTLAFGELQKTKEEEIINSPLPAQISKIIRHYTNLNLTISVADYDPCVEIPPVNRNNILVRYFERNQMGSQKGIKLIEDAGGVARGSVSLKKAKVSGVWADIETTIHLPLNRFFLNTKFTPEEITAITLHEIGHIFTYFEFMSRTITTNQVLAGLSKALDESGSVEERESVLISVKHALNLTELDEKQLAQSTSKTAVELVVIANTVEKTRSELGANICDSTTWEYLCDQFAARQGAGRYLVTGLEKYYRSQNNISFRSTPMYLFMEAIKLLMVFSAFWVSAIALSGTPFPLAGLFVNLATKFGIILIFMEHQGGGVYDTPEARMKRIRDQVVENLKDTKLKPDDRERLLADLETIDDILNSFNERRQFFSVLWDTIIPSARKHRSQLKLQQDLENLAANELFVQAARLRAMA